MSESRRKKAEMLRRAIATGDFASAERLLRPPGQGAADRAAEAQRRLRAEPMTLSEACPGRPRKVAAASGEAALWAIRRTLAEAEPQGVGAARELASVLRGSRQRFDELAASVGLCHAADAQPEDLLLAEAQWRHAGVPEPFLIGLMYIEGGEAVFEQFLARRPEEAAGVLAAFVQRWQAAGVLVTFGRKSAGLAAIRKAMSAHDVAGPWQEPPHLDLRREALARWRGQVRRFTLRAMEGRFSRRRRPVSLSDSAVTDAYWAYLAGGDARPLRAVLRHNRLNLLAMAEVLAAMLTGCEPAGQ